MSNVDELVEEVARVIDPGAWWPELHIDSARKRRSAARHRSKAAIKAVLWGIRGMKIPDTQSPDNLEYRTLDPFALDALLKQLED